MPEGFTDEELREAAREAGISPVELRGALAERAGLPARRPNTLPAAIEGPLPVAVPSAIAAMRRHLEQATGRTGHGQGDDRGAARWDLVDDDAGLTYRVHAEDDGNAGSLVRVEIDTSAGKGALALAGSGTGAVVFGVLAVAWLFSWTTLAILGVVGGALGALYVARNAVALAKARHHAEGIAAGALGAAQDALPATSSHALPPSP